ncbi:MAG: cation diffusion facilitator family transporter [Deltaproteobacteria bacterium]|nr:cation diffusion facilitator family transporter [Deltaproteobacteria bacterium]
MTDTDARLRVVSRVTVLGAAVNVFLALLKAFAGVVGGSAVMIADAVHSLSDLATDVVALVALRLAARPPDEGHPYGHGRFETLASFLLALVLMGAAGGIALDALERFAAASEPGMIALWAALVSVAFKEALYQVTVRVGRRHRSPLVVANAWHHRSDALSSIAALIGIAGARMGFPFMDPAAAVVVAALIAWTGFQILANASREVTDASLERDMLLQMQDAINALPGVVDLHELRARRMGPRVLVDLHVQVDGSTTVSDGHQVALRVGRFVQEKHPEVSEVLVHIDPEADIVEDPPLWRPREELERDVRTRAETVPGLHHVTHVLVHYLQDRVAVQADIVVDPEVQVREAAKVADTFRRSLLDIDDVNHADVHLELDPEAHGVLPEPLRTKTPEP